MFSSNTTQVSDGGYQISRSLRFNSADTAYLNRTPASAGNRRTFTVSAWVKRAALGTSQYLWEGGSPDGQTTRLLCRFNTDDTLRVATGSTIVFNTTQVFRDPSSWYHIVVAIDTPNATQASRARLYVNGSEVTTFSSASYFGQNDDTGWNMAQAHSIGRSHVDSAGYLSAYITEFYNVDGSQLTPSSFGETSATTGVWQPKAYSGSYGTNGFYLNFSDNSNTTAATLGKDYSGNGNNWTPNNFSVTAGAGNDSLVDSPTSYGTTDTGVGGEIRGNYATWNPLTQSSGTASNGNLQYYGPNSWKAIASTFLLPSTGKWFAEVVLLNAPLSGNFSDMWNGFGVIAPSAQSAWSYNSGTSFFISDTGHYSNYSTGSTGNFTGNTTGTVLGLAFDRDTNQITVYQNGVSKATVTVGVTSGSDLYFFNGSYSATYGSMAVNFGQRPFAYTAPSGYKALCTQNLPTPTIGATTATLANLYFNPVLYTGDRTDRTITVGFQPDWVWVKSRNAADDHYLMNAVVGTGKYLNSNSTAAETTNANSLTAYTSTGFSVGNTGTTNETGRTYVAWNWKANGSGSTNTAGTITSTVSANTTSGFSIVTYTGSGTSLSTVGHGLGAVPSMVIVKARSASGLSWYVYQKDVGNTKFLELNTTAAPTTFNLWESTSPTSSVFTISNNSAINGSGTTFVAYCFAPIAGYSAFGSYTGNGSTDGPFVFTGFRPAYVMFKRTDVANDWVINDATRSAYNQTINVLYANDSAAENTTGAGNSIDILSNGFKLRQTNNGSNASGGTYIFMAFATSPFKYSLAR